MKRRGASGDSSSPLSPRLNFKGACIGETSVPHVRHDAAAPSAPLLLMDEPPTVSDPSHSVQLVVKIDPEAVARLLASGRGKGGRRYDYLMPTFTLDGESFEYLQPESGHGPEEARSWTYGNYPKVRAGVPLAGGGAVSVYAHAERWNPSSVLVRWSDDGRHSHWAWIPAGSVERLTDSEWDIEEYRRCPGEFRAIRWCDRLPGFLPQ